MLLYLCSYASMYLYIFLYLYLYLFLYLYLYLYIYQCLHISISTSISVVGRGNLNRIQVDTGSNILCGPVPLGGCATIPITDSVSIADDSSVAITGRGTVCGKDFYLAPTFSNALMPQSYVS